MKQKKVASSKQHIDAKEFRLHTSNQSMTAIALNNMRLYLVASGKVTDVRSRSVTRKQLGVICSGCNMRVPNIGSHVCPKVKL